MKRLGRSLLLMLLGLLWALGLPMQLLAAVKPSITDPFSPDIGFSQGIVSSSTLSTSARFADFSGPGVAELAMSDELAISDQQAPPSSADERLQQLIDQGLAFYQAGQTHDAIAPWQTAVPLAQTQGTARDQAIIHHYLAIAYQDLENWNRAEAEIAQSLNHLSAIEDPFLRAQVLNTQGSMALRQGHAQTALEQWQQAEGLYRQVDALDPLLRNQLNQVQALRALGFYRRSRDLLETVNQTLAPLPDSSLKLRGLQSLGGLLRRQGEIRESQEILEEGLAIAQRLAHPQELQALQLSLVQTLLQGIDEAVENQPTRIKQREVLGQNRLQRAIDLLQQVQTQAKDRPTQIQAQLQQIQLLITIGQTRKAWAIAQSLYPQLSDLPASRWGIYAQIQFVRTLMEPSALASRNGVTLPQSQSNQSHFHRQAPQLVALLQQAVEQARSLQDSRAESYALGTLGAVYEQRSQVADGLQLTAQALTLAQQIQAVDLVAQWQWQRGRLLTQQSQADAARVAYDDAFEQLEVLQQDLVAMGPEIQLSFRGQIEPIYRQYVVLLLQDMDAMPTETQQERLERCRQVIESLQLAELQNYFRQTCLTYDTRNIETIDPAAAVFYPILLDDRIEVILSLPNQPLRHYSSPISQTEQNQLFRQAYASLNGAYKPQRFQTFSQRLYQYLIEPATPSLQEQQITTLVFVADGFLRNLPMAALYDGEHYLVENYSVALSPGLRLLNAQKLAERSPSILSAGLTEARQGFLPLPAVEQELEEIQGIVAGDRLLDQTFSQANLTDRLSQQALQIVHLATHGKFSSRADETYLVTWDGRVTVKELDRIFQNRQTGATARPTLGPLDLLVLSACQTAVGDEQATLGMAGMAVRSGARSTVATLWSVNDESTALFMAQFYRYLIEDHLSRGEALRQAQIGLLKQPNYRRPYYWAPFVLVGNWL